VDDSGVFTVLPDDGPVRSETGRRVAYLLNILLGICDNLSVFVG
jgi:hypothetical protein